MKGDFLFALLAITGVICQKAEDYKIKSLPGIDITTLGFSQYAGHIELSKKSNANIFFWMIEQEEKTDPGNVIIWLNGGPGCSSMDGLFLENGPFRVEKNLSLSINEGGWQNYATNIYVDQPVGTGFSFADSDSYVHTMAETTDGFIQFIDKLFMIFPNLRQQSLYLSGESFAGSYIPYFASRLLNLNKEKEQYNLKGIAIGNGWISAKHQYNAYHDFSLQKELVAKDRLDILNTHFEDCQKDLNRKETIHISSCEKVLTDVTNSNIRENKDGETVCMNVYDIRMRDEPYPECGLSWPYELSDMTRYLRLDAVKKAIHAERQSLGWKECTSTVGIALNDDQSPSSYYLLPEILKEIPVLLYKVFDWEYDMGWIKGLQDGKLAGYYTRDRNLTYVVIKDGSHMVPYDKPIECLDMINRFMQVGDNVVKGKQSQVGDLERKEDTHKDSMPEQEDRAKKVGDKTWSAYYSLGTAASAAILLLFLVLGCYLCTRSKRPSPTAEFGGAPRQEREGVKKPGVLAYIKNLFKNNGNHQKKLRLGDQDETNELDELVVGTSILFEPEEGFEEDSHSSSQIKQPTGHFVVADQEDESDFEDFDNWDEGSDLNKNKLH
ncbi:hypothetical protein G6F37_008085 [Rhizopus arrhizus]|nr:hypothetical protein G6F38_005010 [Rhizopus arrhizus]KAG1155924.1 hypothetical protein G6F37_008085 [Rhizopus arrhizus]